MIQLAIAVAILAISTVGPLLYFVWLRSLRVKRFDLEVAPPELGELLDRWESTQEFLDRRWAELRVSDVQRRWIEDGFRQERPIDAGWLRELVERDPSSEITFKTFGQRSGVVRSPIEVVCFDEPPTGYLWDGETPAFPSELPGEWTEGGGDGEE